MKINADNEGNILGWGVEIIGIEYVGEIPEDFTNGKYLFLNGKIILNENYVENNTEETI